VALYASENKLPLFSEYMPLNHSSGNDKSGSIILDRIAFGGVQELEEIYQS
jgi:hypothetical protein